MADSWTVSLGRLWNSFAITGFALFLLINPRAPYFFFLCVFCGSTDHSVTVLHFCLDWLNSFIATCAEGCMEMLKQWLCYLPEVVMLLGEEILSYWHFKMQKFQF